MAVQTEPFRAGPWAGRMPADVYAESGDPSIPVYSKRQTSLREYIMMLSAAEQRCFTCDADRQAATDSADGVSAHGAVTWVRAGVVAATYAHGPKLRLCDNSMCETCLIVWRQTMDARICQVCEKPMVAFRGLGQPLTSSDTTPVWLRSVHADPRNGEPRLHFSELETCSDRCKQIVLSNFAKRGDLSRNDFIDSADALRKEPHGPMGFNTDFDQLQI